MGDKNIKYTSQNLFDIECLERGVRDQIREYEIQKRIIDGRIGELMDIAASLCRHIETIKKQNEEEEENND